MTIEKWLPDWRNLNEYPGEKTTDYHYAWEFLRRNTHYQKCYREHGGEWKPGYKLSQDIQRRFGLDINSPLIDPSFIEPFIRIYSHGTSNESRSRVDYYLLFQGEDPRIQTSGKLKLNDSQVSVTFDLSAPLKPQLDKVEKLLTQDANKKANEFRARRNMYTRYLRILDAHNSKIPPIDIFDVLFPDSKYKKDKFKRDKISESLTPAQNMVLEGYRYLGVGAFSDSVAIPNRTIQVLPNRK